MRSYPIVRCKSSRYSPLLTSRILRCILALAVSVSVNIALINLSNDRSIDHVSVIGYGPSLSTNIKLIADPVMADLELKRYGKVFPLPADLSIEAVNDRLTAKLTGYLATTTTNSYNSLTEICTKTETTMPQQLLLREIHNSLPKLTKDIAVITEIQEILDDEKPIVQGVLLHQSEKNSTWLLVLRILAFALCILILISVIPTKTQSE